MPAVETTGIVEGFKRTYTASVAGMARGLAVVNVAGNDGQIAVAGANAPAFGVLEEATVFAGSPASVVRLGECDVVYGAAVAAGQRLITDAQGRLVPSAAAGDNIIGYAISSGANAGDYGVAFILPSIR